MRNQSRTRAELSRRAFLGTGLAAAGGVLTGCGIPVVSAASVSLRVTSYGDPVKLKIRGEAVAKFNHTHPKIQMSYEGYPSSNYFDKLATQFSGGNPPSVINMDPVHLQQYARSKALHPLEEYVGKTIQTSSFEHNLLAQGKDRNTLYGLPVGVSTYGVGYDKTLLDRLKIHVDPTWTYTDFANLMVHLHKAQGPKFYGTEDASGDWASFEVYLRAHGGMLYRDAKQLAFSVTELGDWWRYWEKMRKSGGCVPADVAAEYTYDDNSGGPVIKKLAAFEHIYTPNFAGGYQSLSKDTLRLTTPPLARAGSKHGAYQSPSSVMVMSQRNSAKDKSAVFIDWICNSPQSGAILRFISGPMASATALSGTKGSMSTAEAEVVRYTNLAPRNAIAPPPLAPAVDSQINSLFLRTSQDISFGHQKLAAAVKGFVKQANALLGG